MTELDMVGRSDNFNFKRFPSFLQVCDKAKNLQSAGKAKKKMECLHTDGSVIYL